MKKTFDKLTISVLLPMLLSIGPSALARDITVPKGTDVMLVFDQSLSSKTARAGDRVAFHVADDVMVGGNFVVGKQINIKPGDRALTEVAQDTLVKTR